MEITHDHPFDNHISRAVERANGTAALNGVDRHFAVVATASKPGSHGGEAKDIVVCHVFQRGILVGYGIFVNGNGAAFAIGKICVGVEGEGLGATRNGCRVVAAAGAAYAKPVAANGYIFAKGDADVGI